MLTRMDMDDRGAHDMIMDDVSATLLVNSIPISWIDHSYTFGLHYLNHHLDGSPGSLTQFEEVDDSCLIQLAVWGIPLAIPEWDGWRIPNDEDLHQLRAIMAQEEEKDHYCLDDSPDWLLAEKDPHFDQLCTHQQPHDPTVYH
jgi:hypothetical protein